jgi:hypothetical protein
MTDIVERLRDPSSVRCWSDADAQRAEVAALRADAERYRWLRTTCAAEQARSIFSVAAPAEIDAAIDAALAAKEPK